MNYSFSFVNLFLVFYKDNSEFLERENKES